MKLTGVCWIGRKTKWRAYIDSHGKRIILGEFEEWWDAACARKAAENIYHNIIPDPEPKLCAGVCGENLKRKYRESPAQYEKRQGCGKPGCTEAIRERIMFEVRAKNAKWYHEEPDMIERFCRGMV